MPPRSTRLGGADRRAGYLTAGYPDFEHFLSAQAKQHGWTYVEQFGAAHILVTERYRLTAVTRKCTRFLTMTECVLTER